MFLKSIELFGFKSFADRTAVEFSDGISALLGPNGCGKSNVVDAVKWVLGEQATKSLRADKMEDVIFNGTEQRKALNVAEVTLVLSNDTGILPIELSEISIKRRLYRSGESEYYVNGKSVRLRDIRELFYDTGIGKSAYSIMEQGKIDQVLSNKPEERRNIFEEAATITKFKIKGQEAERKLERTEENMRQVDNILSEVKRSYDSLQKQSEKTLKYREIREKSFGLEVELQLLRLKSFIEQQDRRQVELKEAEELRNSIKSEINGINESMENRLDQVNSMESRLIESQKKVYGIDLEINSRENQVRMLSERSSEVKAKLETERNREKNIRVKLDTVNKDIIEKQTNIQEISIRIGEIEENINNFQQNIEAAAQRIRQNEDEIQKKQSEITELDGKQVNLEDDLRQITDDIVSELDRGLKDSGYSFKERKQLEEQLINKFASLKIIIKGKRDLYSDYRDSDNLSSAESKRIIEQNWELLTRLDEEFKQLESFFNQYYETNPRFLDDFIAPEGIITKKRTIDGEIDRIRGAIRECRTRIADLGKENSELSIKIDEYRKTLEELRLNLVQIQTQKTAIQDSLLRSKNERDEQQKLLFQNQEEIKSDEERIERIKEQVEEIQKDKIRLESEEKKLKEDLKNLEQNISSSNNELREKERTLKAKMESLGKVQSKLEGLQMKMTEISTEIRNIYENFQDRHSRDLHEYESGMYEIRKEPKDLRDELTALKDEQKSLGHLNLMAPEEFAEVKERYDFLSGQLEDLRKAREDLHRVTKEIKMESSELFVQTYEKIKRNFHMMFRRLFGGGRAELRLSDPDNVLQSGIEIFAQPPGKKLESINLLSGGEKSLTAVSLLFATYMVKPSPFCLLDEIDAALDEQNVGRFINMLMEFSESSQFIIITHNKKTVAGCKTLLGVTMEESGVSRMITLRLDKLEPVNA